MTYKYNYYTQKEESGKKISSKLYKKSKEQVTVHIPVQKADVPAYSETKIRNGQR